MRWEIASGAGRVAVKLFSNCYLATRISFFNELDTLGIEKNLNVEKIINIVYLIWSNRQTNLKK